MPGQTLVRPVGNSLTSHGASASALRRRALGKLGALPDSLLVRLLDILVSTTEPLDAARSLCAFSAASTFTNAFAADEDLWRRIVFMLYTTKQIANTFTNSWRETFLILVSDGRRDPRGPSSATSKSFVYSDVLFHKWRCQTTAIDPVWLSNDNVPRISASTTSALNFRRYYEEPGQPVVITDVVRKWPAFNSWTCAGLDERCGASPLHAGGFEFTSRDYFQYCEAVEGHDDQPLYIFDKDFAEKVPQLKDEYSVPEYFAEDLFKVLGEEQRPDYRWLIIGPARSGSSFHKDPNATNAWNAVIRGQKKWILFPPDCPPPGVHPSGDGGDVTTPVSISEWFLNFYDQSMLETYGARECIVGEGEMIFVPMGWWHCVLNTATSVAVTQNYVSSANVRNVATWLRNKPNQISGCRSKEQATFISQNFPRLVLEQYPELYEKLNGLVPAQNGEYDAKSSTSTKRRKTSLWDSLQTHGRKSGGFLGNAPEQISPSNKSSSGFSFGF